MEPLQLSFVDPTIRAYLDYAFIFGMSSESRPYRNFLYNHFGNLCFVQSDTQQPWDALDCFPAPRLRQLTQSGVVAAEGWDFWRERDDAERTIVPFFQARLAEGKYAYVVLDDYYLQGRAFYRQRHYVHHCLVVGCDQRAKKMGLVSYFDSQDRDFGIQWVDHRDFARAFAFKVNTLSDPDQNGFAVWCYRYVKTFQVAPEFRCELDLSAFATQLEGYLHSSIRPDQRRWHNKDLPEAGVSFGVSVYDRLIEWIEGKKRNVFVHAGRMLWEHKRFMLEKVEFIRTQGHAVIEEATVAELRQVVAVANEIRLLNFAAFETKSDRILRRLVEKLGQCREMEKSCYAKLGRQLSLRSGARVRPPEAVPAEEAVVSGLQEILRVTPGQWNEWMARGRLYDHRSYILWRNLEGGRIDHGDLSGRDLAGARFSGAKISHTSFRQCSLRGAVFARCEIEEVDFSEALLFGVDFSGASMRNVKFSGARIFSCTFGGCQMQGTTFHGADLCRSSLQSLNLVTRATLACSLRRSVETWMEAVKRKYHQMTRGAASE